ncbi:MAG: winged helix DNA-binding protein [Candidatus Bathyarchaeota archaeon]|nr:winged helix DNA-binding protein [Candidatus Bathyarchaeota archaeon]
MEGKPKEYSISLYTLQLMLMQQPQPTTNSAFTNDPDTTFLQLYPSLLIPKNGGTRQKTRIQRRLLCIATAGTNGPSTISSLAGKTGLSHFQAAKTLKELSALALVNPQKNGRKVTYELTTKGTVALMAFEGFRNWQPVKSALAVPQKKNDSLAYALPVIGFSSNKPDTLYQTIRRYAAQGATIENSSAEAAAESLLFFYRQQLRAQSPVPPAYLSVFKEFTTTGFQDFFKMLLVAVKPTAEDYNWLVEFFNEISEFHFDPARVAFINLLPQTHMLQQKLEEFKKNQDQQIKKQNGNLEVTFTIPGSGLSKVDAMPPHLRAIGMRLILEPAKFINNALVEYFWGK